MLCLASSPLSGSSMGMGILKRGTPEIYISKGSTLGVEGWWVEEGSSRDWSSGMGSL